MTATTRGYQNTRITQLKVYKVQEEYISSISGSSLESEASLEEQWEKDRVRQRLSAAGDATGGVFDWNRPGGYSH